MLSIILFITVLLSVSTVAVLALGEHRERRRQERIIEQYRKIREDHTLLEQAHELNARRELIQSILVTLTHIQAIDPGAPGLANAMKHYASQREALEAEQFAARVERCLWDASGGLDLMERTQRLAIAEALIQQAHKRGIDKYASLRRVRAELDLLQRELELDQLLERGQQLDAAAALHRFRDARKQLARSKLSDS